MKCLTLPACVLVSLLSGAGLLRLASQAAQHPHYGPGVHPSWPLTLMGVGLLLAGASLGIRVGLNERTLVFHRGARLTLLGGLTLGTALALVGLLAALTPLI
jgi:hypothetical protein